MGGGPHPTYPTFGKVKLHLKQNSVLGRDMFVLMRVATSKKKHNEQSPFLIGDTSSNDCFPLPC